MTMRRGLTLIELLMSITLGMILIAIAASALVQVGRVAKRDTAHRQAHDDVGVIYRSLQNKIEALYHPSQMRVEADPGADGWGTGDEVITLMWMSSERNLRHRDMGITFRLVNDLVWNQLQWEGDGNGGGTLSYAVSSQRREITSHSYDISGATYSPVLSTIAQARRDRRRDMNDNDLRFVPGMTQGDKATTIDEGLYDGIGMPGDRDDLAANLKPLHPPTTTLAACLFSWTDAAGYTVTCSPQSGISITNASGGAVPHLNADFSRYGTGLASTEPHVHVIDGTFLDGREFIPAGDTARTAMAQRPAVVQVAFTLITTSQSGLELDQEPTFAFSLSFNASSKLPSL